MLTHSSLGTYPSASAQDGTPETFDFFPSLLRKEGWRGKVGSQQAWQRYLTAVLGLTLRLALRTAPPKPSVSSPLCFAKRGDVGRRVQGTLV